MARSYRKHPIIKDHIKDAKKFANRKVRRSKDVPNGNVYRRYYNQYDVSDWSFRKTVGQAVDDWYSYQAPYCSRGGDENPKDVVKNWAKDFYWK